MPKSEIKKNLRQALRFFATKFFKSPKKCPIQKLQILQKIMTNFMKKFNPSDYEIKGFTNPYKPDLDSKPKEPTIPMNPEIYKNSSLNQTSNQ